MVKMVSLRMKVCQIVFRFRLRNVLIKRQDCDKHNAKNKPKVVPLCGNDRRGKIGACFTEAAVAG